MNQPEFEKKVRDVNSRSGINRACPYCDAAPLQRCRTAGGARSTAMHHARLEAMLEEGGAS